MHKLNHIKLKPGLGYFHASQPGNGLDLLYSSQSTHGTIRQRTETTYYETSSSNNNMASGHPMSNTPCTVREFTD